MNKPFGPGLGLVKKNIYIYIFFSPKKYIELGPDVRKNIYIYIFFILEKIYIYIYFSPKAKKILGKNRVFVNNFGKNLQISEKIYIYIFFSQNSQV